MCSIVRTDLIEKEYQSSLSLPPKEFWNSSYIKDRRKKFLAGTAPEECLLCIEKNKPESYRYTFLNSHLKDFIADSKNVDRETGHWLQSPQSIDLRLPLCNLRCQICTPEASSSFRNLFKKNEKYFRGYPELERMANFKNTKTKTTVEYQKELIDSGQLKKAYFAGGEPLLIPNHLEDLKNLLIRNKEVKVLYNTNLSSPLPVIEKWIKVLNQSNYARIAISFDGTDEIGEFLRDGFDFQSFEKNLVTFLREKSPHLYTILDMTLTSLNFFNLIETAKFAIKHQVKIDAKIMIPSIGNHLLIENLPLKVRKLLYDEFLVFFESLNLQEKSLLMGLNDTLKISIERPELGIKERKKNELTILLYEKIYNKKKTFREMIDCEAYKKKFLQGLHPTFLN